MHNIYKIISQMYSSGGCQRSFFSKKIIFKTNLHRLISAAIGRWVTSDPAELPFLPGRKKLSTSAVEYNP